MANQKEDNETNFNFEVIHPLDDVPEEKLSYKTVGLIKMSPTVKISLMILRGYLLLMTGFVFYYVLYQAGVFGPHK